MMKTERKEPVYLIEMPHTIRHIIMRRAMMLRGCRTRTLICMNKGGSKAWLEAKLIPAVSDATDESWDKAHELADKFKREFRTNVYVEPAVGFGRFQELTSPPELFDNEQNEMFSTGPGMDFGPGQIDAFGTHPAGANQGFGQMGAAGGMISPSMASSSFGGMGRGAFNMPGMPLIPDPLAALPQSVQAMLNPTKKNNRSGRPNRPDLTFCALHNLPGWDELPESKRHMFEVEAAQLNAADTSKQYIDETSIIDSTDTKSSEYALAALTVNLKVSAALKRFLLESFEQATEKPAD